MAVICAAAAAQRRSSFPRLLQPLSIGRSAAGPAPRGRFHGGSSPSVAGSGGAIGEPGTLYIFNEPVEPFNPAGLPSFQGGVLEDPSR